MASHLLLLEDEYRRRGLSASEARRAARLALGGVERAKELHRDARSFAWVDETRRDLQYAARMLASNVGFTLAIVLTIGVAIGGTGAVFSLVNAVLLKTLPYRDPARLVVIGEGNARGDVAPVNYALLTSHNEVFASIAAITGLSATLNGDRPEKIQGRRRHAQLLRRARRDPSAGARVSRRRGRPGGAACGHTQPRLLARPLRRRPGHRRSRPPTTDPTLSRGSPSSASWVTSARWGSTHR